MTMEVLSFSETSDCGWETKQFQNPKVLSEHFPHRQINHLELQHQKRPFCTIDIQSVSGGIVNILGGGSMDYSE
jgi:hypothetical protein